MKNSVTDYADKVQKILVENSYAENKINEVVNKILDPYKKIDPIANIKGYKSLKKIYLSEVNPDDMFYASLNTSIKALCVKTGDTTYSVAFSFFNSNDDYELLAKGNSWKKYPLVNYIKNRFKYDVTATSFINAVCLAFNKNRNNFPHKAYKHKVHPVVWFMRQQSDYNNPYLDNIEVPVDTPPYFKNTGFEYYNCKQYLKSVVDLTNVRYYIPSMSDCLNPGVSALVVKENDTFTVTFSFLSKPDKNYVDDLVVHRAISNTDFINASKVALINNKKNGKYTYVVSDAKNSISSVIKAFNQNRLNFPSRYRKYKVKLNIELF